MVEGVDLLKWTGRVVKESLRNCPVYIEAGIDRFGGWYELMRFCISKARDFD